MMRCGVNSLHRLLFQPSHREETHMSLINTQVQPFKTQAFHNGKFIDVSDESLKGKWSVLIFMPAAFTFNCPTEVEDAAENYAEFQKAAKFAAAEKAAIDSANPNDSTLPKSPYVGVQFAAIPEFQAIGATVGQQMSAALAGKSTVDAALKASQVAAEREMKKAGYYK